MKIVVNVKLKEERKLVLFSHPVKYTEKNPVYMFN